MSLAQQTLRNFEPLRKPVTPITAPLKRITLPSSGVGPVASNFDQLLHAWETGKTTVMRPQAIRSGPQDFSRATRDLRRLEMKTEIATVAMHLNPDWRRSLFKQIDNLLDIGHTEWEAEHELPTVASWKTFLRLVIHYGFRTRPSLGMLDGNISAIWLHNDIRITIDALPDDNVRWTASRNLPDSDEREAVAGESTLKRLSAFLSPFDANDWLLNG